MVIIDKASWQIDGGIENETVVAHFKKIFKWLASKKLLTAEGQEILELGIDKSISIHERMVTPEALTFLKVNYDDYLKQCPYGTDLGASMLDAIYCKVTNNKK